MNEHKVTINGAEYLVDIEKAERDGYLKRARSVITDVKAGDVFVWASYNEPFVIFETFMNRYIMTGLKKNPFKAYSNRSLDNGYSKEALIDELKGSAIYLGNVADQTNTLAVNLFDKAKKEGKFSL